MRALMVAAPLLGHAFPLVPVGRALVAAGHEVTVATGGGALAVRRSGLPVEDVAPGLDFGRIARGVMLRHPLVARRELAGRAGTRGAALLFTQVRDQMQGAVDALVDRWKPDVVLFEPLAVAGAIAAARRGIPAIRHENSLFDGRELVEATSEGIESAAIAVAPPSVVPQDGWPMRYEPYSGPGELPRWLREPADRPRILVSRSTVPGPGSGRLMRAVVQAATLLAVEVVLVRPAVKVRETPQLRTVDWVPLPEALRTADAIVHHGGAGSVLTALAAGVPQLVATGPGDRRHNAMLVAARGAGLAASVGGITAAVLRHLLHDETLREAAREVSAEIAARPDPASLVPRIEGLLAG